MIYLLSGCCAQTRLINQARYCPKGTGTSLVLCGLGEFVYRINENRTHVPFKNSITERLFFCQEAILAKSALAAYSRYSFYHGLRR